jgi:hypothetical protein
MSGIVEIAQYIQSILARELADVEVRYGLASSTGVITANKAVGICLLSKGEVFETQEANQQTATYQVWAYAKPSPPTNAADAEKEVADLMDRVESILRCRPRLDGYVLKLELSETNYNYEEIQAGIFAATAVLNLTVTRMIPR